MPELPDVEHFKQYFNRNALHKNIGDVKIIEPKLIRGGAGKKIKAYLQGKCFESISRRGKFLIANVDKKKIVFHFGMTGSLNYSKQSKKREKYSRVVFYFTNNYKLEWINQRNLGRIYFVDDIKEVSTIQSMGPEPFELKEQEFLGILVKHKRKMVKSLLMDQSIIAGIGNIYSDEILFQSAVLPDRKTSSLYKKEKLAIFNNMKKVLKKGIKIGTVEEEMKSFPQNYVIPHRHSDMECPVCDKELSKKKVSGRTSYFCSNCQK